MRHAAREKAFQVIYQMDLNENTLDFALESVLEEADLKQEAADFCRALDNMYRQPVEVILVGRGGGSLEELWCFNEEAVVRKIASSPVPIISAVGHETDFTLADFAADRRAATPSMAAELAAPEWRQLIQRVDQQRILLCRRYEQLLERKKQRLALAAKHPLLAEPERFLDNWRQLVDQQSDRLSELMERLAKDRENELALAAGRLEALSPLKVLARGYAVCEDKDGRVVRRADDIAVGERIDMTLEQGRLHCLVEDKEVE